MEINPFGKLRIDTEQSRSINHPSEAKGEVKEDVFFSTFAFATRKLGDERMFINPSFGKIAIRAAKESGAILRKNFKRKLKFSFKKDHSLVTEVDLKAEKAIIRLIKENFPSHDIISEESGGRIGKEYTWVIDPLDGTTNYFSKSPFFSTIISLLYKKQPILGIIFNPIAKELYFGEKGKGAFLNGKRIRVNKERILGRAVTLFTKEKFFEILKKVAKKSQTFRLRGCAGLDLCYVASGRAIGFISIDTKNKPWDFSAGSLILREAGGRVTDLKGKNWQIDSNEVVASNGKIHNQILKLLKR